MTAINVIRRKSAVHVLTDGAAYRADGMLAFKTQKVFPLVHLNAVVAARGWPFFATVFGGHASSKTRSFDELKGAVPSLAATVLIETKDAIDAFGCGTEFDLVIAGWSESCGPSSYFLCNHDRHGVEPWAVIELGDISLLPHDDAIKADLEREFPQGAIAGNLDPTADGLRILEAQRRNAVDHGGDHGFGVLHSVGGFAQLTTITPGQIVTKIIRHWPDEIGCPLAADAA